MTHCGKPSKYIDPLATRVGRVIAENRVVDALLCIAFGILWGWAIVGALQAWFD
jgi:hypothetical protein